MQVWHGRIPLLSRTVLRSLAIAVVLVLALVLFFAETAHAAGF